MKTFEGNLVSKGIRVGIVAARFNEFITSKLLGGAMDGLLRHDVREEDIHVAREKILAHYKIFQSKNKQS